MHYYSYFDAIWNMSISMMGVVSRHWILNFSVVAELYIILGGNLDCRRVVLVVEMKVGNGRRGERVLMMALRMVYVFLPLFTSFFLYKKYILYSHLSLSLPFFFLFLYWVFVFCIYFCLLLSSCYWVLCKQRYSYFYKHIITMYIQLFLHT